MKIEGTCDNAANEYAYYERTLSTAFSITTYPYYKVRWKTEVASSGCEASMRFDDSTGGAGHYQEVSLGFSGTADKWTVTTGSFSATDLADGDVKKIRLYSGDNPDALDSGTYDVYYDFFMAYAGTFTLPNTAFGMNIDFAPREAVIPIPSKDTDAIQNLGTQSAVVTIGCDLTEGDWTRTTDTIDGEVFLDMLHNRSSEPWQWLDTGSHQFKVTVHPQFDWNTLSGSTMRRLDLELREYSLGDKSEETYLERYGIGL